MFANERDGGEGGCRLFPCDLNSVFVFSLMESYTDLGQKYVS